MSNWALSHPADIAILHRKYGITADSEGKLYYPGEGPRYTHEVTCSASRSRPVGGEVCSCRLGAEFKRMRRG